MCFIFRHMLETFILFLSKRRVLGPNKLFQCRCPDGLGGQYCTQLAPSGVNSPVQCGAEREAKETPEFIESPGYTLYNGFYEQNTECNWKITVSFKKLSSLFEYSCFVILKTNNLIPCIVFRHPPVIE